MIGNFYLEGLKFKGFTDCTEFYESFSRDKYYKIFKQRNSAQETSNQVITSKHGKSEFQGDVDKLIGILLKTLNETKKMRRLSPHVCEILDFIDKNISQGIVGESFKTLEEPKFIYFKYHMILLSSRIKYTMAVARKFNKPSKKYKRLHNPQPMYEEYHKRIDDLAKEFAEKYSELSRDHKDMLQRMEGVEKLSQMICSDTKQYLKISSN
jgi:hypothetical protein